MHRLHWVPSAFALAMALAACSGGGGTGGGAPPTRVTAQPTPTPTSAPSPSCTKAPRNAFAVAPSPGPTSAGRHKIRHVVVIIQENRSFDNLFYGFPGADTATYGFTHTGKKVNLHPVGLEFFGDLDHERGGFDIEYNHGKMNGFDQEIVFGSHLPPYFAYSYVPHIETKLYFSLAEQYVLADRMFESDSSGSFAAHQYLIAAQSGGVIGSPDNVPWGCDAPAGTETQVPGPGGTLLPGPYPCFTYPTLATLLDAANLSWHYYTPSFLYTSPYYDAGGLLWSAYDASKAVRYGCDWTRDVISPNSQILEDVASGSLPNVSWVAPTFGESDHPRSLSATAGPDWVGSIVDAIGESKYWDSTAIFVLWDDWGGWYEHVLPPQLDAIGLGFRVPTIIVSPYALSHFVTHQQHEYGSIVRFIEGVFGLPSLHQSDERAAGMDDAFNFAQAPRLFQPFAIFRKPDDMLPGSTDVQPPDDD